MLKTLALTAAAILLLATTAEARPRHNHHHLDANGNHYRACDGIHGCRCGSTQTSHFGLPRIYNGYNLWRAVEWTRAFPRTSIHVGAVGFQRRPRDHVFRVVAYNGGSTATVSDDAGTYERNIAGAIFVDVGGGSIVETHSARRHRRVATAESVDWITAH